MKKILLVEDDQFLIKMYGVKLKNSGYDVAMVGDGDHVSTRISEYKPDLILLDLMLPKKDGFTVLKELKKSKESAGIPVIVLTNLGQAEDVEYITKLGAAAYLIKAETRPNQVVEKIREILGE